MPGTPLLLPRDHPGLEAWRPGGLGSWIRSCPRKAPGSPVSWPCVQTRACATPYSIFSALSHPLSHPSTPHPSLLTLRHSCRVSKTSDHLHLGCNPQAPHFRASHVPVLCDQRPSQARRCSLMGRSLASPHRSLSLDLGHGASSDFKHNTPRILSWLVREARGTPAPVGKVFSDPVSEHLGSPQSPPWLQSGLWGLRSTP